jgi:hypothetical protein
VLENLAEVYRVLGKVVGRRRGAGPRRHAANDALRPAGGGWAEAMARCWPRSAGRREVLNKDRHLDRGRRPGALAGAGEGGDGLWLEVTA